MTVPPIDDPVALIPNANDLRFLNQCEMIIGSGPKIIPQDAPVRRPWQRINCQSSLHSAVAAVATTKTTLLSRTFMAMMYNNDPTVLTWK